MIIDQERRHNDAVIKQGLSQRNKDKVGIPDQLKETLDFLNSFHLNALNIDGGSPFSLGPEDFFNDIPYRSIPP